MTEYTNCSLCGGRRTHRLNADYEVAVADAVHYVNHLGEAIDLMRHLVPAVIRDEPDGTQHVQPLVETYGHFLSHLDSMGAYLVSIGQYLNVIDDEGERTPRTRHLEAMLDAFHELHGEELHALMHDEPEVPPSLDVQAALAHDVEALWDQALEQVHRAA
jgi:hypothetical protein